MSSLENRGSGLLAALVDEDDLQSSYNSLIMSDSFKRYRFCSIVLIIKFRCNEPLFTVVIVITGCTTEIRFALGRVVVLCCTEMGAERHPPLKSKRRMGCILRAVEAGP
jgi:hypothetical protein